MERPQRFDVVRTPPAESWEQVENILEGKFFISLGGEYFEDSVQEWIPAEFRKKQPYSGHVTTVVSIPHHLWSDLFEPFVEAGNK